MTTAIEGVLIDVVSVVDDSVLNVGVVSVVVGVENVGVVSRVVVGFVIIVADGVVCGLAVGVV